MLAGHEMSVSSYWHRLLQIPTMESDWPIRPSDSFYLICHQMAGKNPPVKQADFRSFYTCLTASRCKGFERILIKGLAPIFDIIRSNSLSVLDFLFVQQSLFIPYSLLALELSVPDARCRSINGLPNNKQLNVDMYIKNTDRGYIHQMAIMISLMVYDRYNDYDQYMISF